MDDEQLREEFDTGLKRIRNEIKSRLVPHGLFATVTCIDGGPAGQVPDDSRIEIVAKNKTVGRSFDRRQIEGCCLRVGGEVLLGIIAMVDEVAALPPKRSIRPHR
ncbi:MAG TPA: hypothetical protein VN692_11745 [Steroidobacteraceae bacterium]|nr:hypothetical protein [Steroidobacteraceae bacterium]